MQGIKEVAVSCSVALALLYMYSLQRVQEKTEQRPSPPDPVVSSDLNESDDEGTPWGIETLRVPEAWKIQRGSKDIVVAVIDTGCDIHHPSLKENLWRNPGESGRDGLGHDRASNGIDDDDNGFVDDFHGWNFVLKSSDLSDEHGHGTHIAGIIGAEGPIGVAPKVSLMILKYFDVNGTGYENVSRTAQAITYAVHMGAHIINYSGGGVLKSPAEEQALKLAKAQGVLVIAAAGNGGLNSDFHPFYPANYDFSNIISVGAIDQEGHLLPQSNFGLESVDITAPGRNIYSTLPNGLFGFMSGTSQATAFVSGVTALMLASTQGQRDPVGIKDQLLQHAVHGNHLKGRVASGARIDALLALSEQKLEWGARPRSRVTASWRSFRSQFSATDLRTQILGEP